MRHVEDLHERKDGKRVDGRVSRKVRAPKHGTLVVTLAPEGIYLREPRRRTAFLMPYGAAFLQAAKMKADEDRRERKANRKRRK